MINIDYTKIEFPLNGIAKTPNAKALKEINGLREGKRHHDKMIA